MRIGIVLHPFGSSAKGLEQSIFETTRTLIREGDDTVSFTVFTKGKPNISEISNGIEVIHLPNIVFWQWFLFPVSRKYDYFIFFTESAPYVLWKKSIIHFYDAAYYYFGSRTMIGRIRRKILVIWRSCMMRHAKHIVAISEASKRDLIEKFNVSAEHITVIYLGFKSLMSHTREDTVMPEKPFFVYVGPIKERKNVLAIVEAFSAFKKRTGLPHELLLIGRETQGAYEKRVREYSAASEYTTSIIFKMNVSDTELGKLYTKAEALVFPSLIEGFGFPILEAFSCGCMVITSETTSTKEVSGTAGILVNPHRVDEITDALVSVARHEYSRDEFVKNAQQQLALFSWEKSGREWHEMLKTL